MEKKNKNWVKAFFKFTTWFVSIAVILAIGGLLSSLYGEKIKDFFQGKQAANTTIVDTKVEVTSEENVIIDVVEQANASVVSVAVSKLKFTPGEGVVDQNDKIGTGFIVDKGGLIVTNQHVVSDNTAEYKVVTSDGKAHDVIEILVDNVNDIALLKVEADDLTPLSLGSSESLKVGQLVIAIGTPLGEYSGSVTTGIISGLNRSVTTSSGSFLDATSKEYYDVIQTDAAINPGNSGGPLLDSSARVIGVNFATTSGADNISFALPIDIVKTRLSEYRKYGKFLKPYMGVEYQMISESAALYYEDIVAGALIVRVTPNSPASEAGFKRSDIIVKIEEQKVSKSLSTVIQSYKVGDELDVELWRDGKTIKTKITLAEAD